jgi:hypothetical protein
VTERIPLDDLTSDKYDELCNDLDRYEEVQGEMNETAINLTRQAARAEATLAQVRNLRDDLRATTGARWIAVALDNILNPTTPPPVSGPTCPRADRLATALREVLARLYALTRADGSVIGYQTVNPITPAVYERWQAILNPPASAPTTTGPCPACRRAPQAGLDTSEQHPDCTTPQQP